VVFAPPVEVAMGRIDPGSVQNPSEQAYPCYFLFQKHLRPGWHPKQ